MSKIIIDTDALPYWLTSNTKYLSWWLDLLMHGERVDSIRNLSKRWTQDKRSPAISVVQNYLKKLRRENLLAEQNPNRTRTEPERVIICSYASYVNLGNGRETEGKRKGNKPSKSTLINTRAQDSINISLFSQSEIDIENSKNTSSLRSDVEEDSEKNEVEDIYKFYCEEYRLAKSSTIRPTKLNQERKASIAARLREYGADAVKEVIRKAMRSEFLNGGNDRGWRANIDFVFTKSKFLKILEGAYEFQTSNHNGNNNRPTDKAYADRRSTDVTAKSAAEYKTRF